MSHIIDVLNQRIWIKFRNWKKAHGFNIDTEGWKDNEKALDQLLDGFSSGGSGDAMKRLNDEKNQLAGKISKLTKKVSYVVGTIDKDLPAKMPDVKKEFDKIDKG